MRTRAVVDWRQSCERKFTFNPALAVSEADKNAVRAKFAVRRRVLEAALSMGANELQQFRHEAARKTTSLWPKVADAAQRFAQAKADYALLS